MNLVSNIFMYILLISCLACASTKNNASKMVVVSGTIYTTEQYCTGAPPDEELMRRLKTPKPLPHYKLYIKAGTTNEESSPVLATILTNEVGQFTVELPQGNYVLINEVQLNKDIFEPQDTDVIVSDKEKLQAWWTAGLISISQSQSDIQLSFHKKCNLPLGVPGLRYKGPIAP